MEYVRLKYANKKGYTYVGFIPVLFGPSGKTLEIDLIFKKPEGAKVDKPKDTPELAKK